MATPITFVQSASGFGLGGVVTLSSPATIGNALIALYAARSVVSSSGPTSAHGTWVLLRRQQHTNMTLELWFCPNIASTSQSITFPTDPNIEIGAVSEYTGIRNNSWELRNSNTGAGTSVATPTTGISSKDNELFFAGAAFANGSFLYTNITNGFSLRENKTRGSGTTGVLIGLADKIISSKSSAQTTLTVGTSYNWITVISGFTGYDVYTINHTTDSLLKGTFTKTHTTDSLLKGTFTRQHISDSYLRPSPALHTADSLLYKQTKRDHFTDSVLVGALQLIHGTDCSIAGVARIPEFTRILEFTSVGGENVGAFDVKLLSQNGNGSAPQQFTYNVPAQEAILGSSHNTQIDIIDPIVKDKA